MYLAEPLGDQPRETPKPVVLQRRMQILDMSLEDNRILNARGQAEGTIYRLETNRVRRDYARSQHIHDRTDDLESKTWATTGYETPQQKTVKAIWQNDIRECVLK